MIGYGPKLEVFGTTLPTFDGSAIRDYVHVCDVARANLRALDSLKQGSARTILNIGSGIGSSVLQIVDAVSKEVGQPVKFLARPARLGDPTSIVADRTRAQICLGWTPVESDLSDIVASVVSFCEAGPRS